jgi:GDPmannose 4,6-dehydratase
MKKVMISGIKGQLASYLADLYLAKGDMVIGFERRSAIPNYSNIDHVLDNENFVLENGDITDPSSISRLLMQYKPDIYINTAAQSHVGESFNQAVSTCDIDFTAVTILLEAVRSICPTTKVMHLSSSEVYGDTQDDPIQNESTPVKPMSVYAVCKAGSEMLCDVYRKSYGIWAGYVRVFNMESPRRSKQFVTRKITDWIAHSFSQVETKLIPEMVKHRKNTLITTQEAFETALTLNIIKPLHLGNLEARRDWQHCKDAARGIISVIDLDTPDLFVFGTGTSRSIREFLDAAFAEVGISDWSKLVFQSPKFFRPLEVNLLCADASKAKDKLGWKHEYTFDDLVKEMVKADMVRYGV